VKWGEGQRRSLTPSEVGHLLRIPKSPTQGGKLVLQSRLLGLQRTMKVTDYSIRK
jgi:hypothetical protein